jgi:hypothetical protein
MNIISNKEFHKEFFIICPCNINSIICAPPTYEFEEEHWFFAKPFKKPSNESTTNNSASILWKEHCGKS